MSQSLLNCINGCDRDEWDHYDEPAGQTKTAAAAEEVRFHISQSTTLPHQCVHMWPYCSGSFSYFLSKQTPWLRNGRLKYAPYVNVRFYQLIKIATHTQIIVLFWKIIARDVFRYSGERNLQSKKAINQRKMVLFHPRLWLTERFLSTEFPKTSTRFWVYASSPLIGCVIRDGWTSFTCGERTFTFSLWKLFNRDDITAKW